MKTVLLVPDSFKGTLSALEACRAMEKALHSRRPDWRVISLPAADGGEGTVDCFLTALGGRRISRTVSGPFGRPVEGFFGLLPGGRAVIEMAACAGLPLAGGDKDPSRTTTYGVGELMLQSLDQGAESLLVGLGGSATNDGGCGAAAACGVRFLDKAGKPFLPTGGTLERIAAIDPSGLDVRLKNCRVTALCDVDNPLCGPRGAAAVFGPQKGAGPEMVARLDSGLLHLAELWKRDLGADLLDLPGGGAAGGMGAGMAAFFGGTLQSGIDALLDAAGFDRLAREAQWIFTGEGRLDGQTLGGKTILGVARRAKALGTPVAALVGGSQGDLTPLYDQGVTAVFSINRLPQPLSESGPMAAENLTFTMENVLRLLEVQS